MVARGVYFALDPRDERKVLEADAEELPVLIEVIEDRWDGDWLAECDKAWEAFDGMLRGDDEDEPQGWLVTGERELLDEDADYYVSHLAPSEVCCLAEALAPLDEAAFRRLYDEWEASDYTQGKSDEDFGYVWSWFGIVRALVDKAAGAGRAIIFTVSQ